MTTSTEIDKAIAAVTHVTGQDGGAKCWVYAQMLWGDHPSAEFTVMRGTHWKRVTLMVDQVKRYQDNGTAFFLIEMPYAMAAALGLETLILTMAELKRLQRSIDTTRAF